MRARISLVLAFALAAVALVMVAPPAHAKTKCTSVVVETGSGVKTVIECSDSSSGSSSSHKGKSKCYRLGDEIPCKSDKGTWYAPNSCWLSLADPQPAYDDPAYAEFWKGRTTGVLYLCYTGLGGSPGYVWFPGAAELPPDPADLAERAVEQMNLSAIRIGIVPEARQGRVGLVGLPVWLWVDEPSDQTWGPISRTASLRGYSVTATAKVSHIRWEMGNGQVVSCSNRGTPYADKYGTQQSPTCGYPGYTKDGTYTVRATSYWDVTWTGMGQTGAMDFTFTRTAQITVGELQVVNR